MLNAQNGKLEIDNTFMDYICIGKGSQVLIMIPGLGDGLKTVKGLALPFSILYREFTKKYKVYVFSRKREMAKPYTSRKMAGDIKKALDLLKVEKADVLGVSQGGTIAQYLAIDYPEVVNKLVLTVTYGKANETVRDVIGQWMEFAARDDYSSIFIDTAEKSYTEAYLKKNRKWYPIMTRIGAPKSYERFLIMADACLTHDASQLLSKITCPALIIGGGQDKIVTGLASKELAQGISGSELYMYTELGHGLYTEAKDFNRRVLAFLER